MEHPLSVDYEQSRWGSNDARVILRDFLGTEAWEICLDRQSGTGIVRKMLNRDDDPLHRAEKEQVQ